MPKATHTVTEQRLSPDRQSHSLPHFTLTLFCLCWMLWVTERGGKGNNEGKECSAVLGTLLVLYKYYSV